MRVPRAFAEGARPGATVELSGEAYHHLSRVLRRSAGECLILQARALVAGDPSAEAEAIRAAAERGISGAGVTGEGVDALMLAAADLITARLKEESSLPAG